MLSPILAVRAEPDLIMFAHGRSFLLAVVLALVFSALARAETAVIVRVAGVEEAIGNVIVSVFDSKKGWLKQPLTIAEVALSASSPQVIELQLSLPVGAYAFHVFHDLDGNGEMKTNFIGIPKEPTGVSNNAKGKFGPPKFKDAAVNIDADNNIVNISLVEI